MEVRIYGWIKEIVEGVWLMRLCLFVGFII